MTEFSKKPYTTDNYKNRKWAEQVSRELGWSQMNELTEKPTGSKWVDQSDICRVVVDCGALPNTTSKNVAHNITFSQIVRIYGITSDGTNYVPLPTPTTGTTQVVLYANATNIVLQTASNLTAYTSTFVTVEYIK
jgi:hypothetical protein